MNRLGSILAATDFSAPVRHAVDRAARRAHETGGALTLMHVLPGGALEEFRHWLGNGHTTEQHLHGSARQQRRDLAEEIKANRHMNAQTAHSIGSVVGDILAEACAQDAGCWFSVRAVWGSCAGRCGAARPSGCCNALSARCWLCGRRRTSAIGMSWWRWTSRPGRPAPSRLRPSWRRMRGCFFSPPSRCHSRRGCTSPASTPRPSIATGERLAPMPPAACMRSWPPAPRPSGSEGDASWRIADPTQEQGCDRVALGKHGQSNGPAVGRRQQSCAGRRQHRWAGFDGARCMSAPSRSQVPIPEHAVRRVVQ